MAEESKNATIKGDPLPLEDMLNFAIVDDADIESALEWFNEHASIEWIGALEAPPIEGA